MKRFVEGEDRLRGVLLPHCVARASWERVGADAD